MTEVSKRVIVDYGSDEGQSVELLSEKNQKLSIFIKDDESRIKMLRETYLKRKEANPNATCPSCGGMSKSNSKCPVCESGGAVEKIVMKQEVELETAEKLFIPNYYVGKVFNPDEIRRSHPSLNGVKEFEDYLGMLSLITDQMNRKSLQLSSLFISAPGGFGKEHFAYSLLQIAVTNGLTVFPYFDLGEVGRLLNAYEERNYRDSIIKDTKFTDVDLANAQVCILKVPHSNNLESYKIAMKVIDRRSRRGLSTIIMSRYNYNYFTTLDKFGEMDSMKAYDNVSPKNIRRVEMTARINSL